MAKNTRLASTIVGKYIPSVGSVDAFYLDGRISGKREENYADLTLDREDRGTFLALYASSHGNRNPMSGEDGNRQILDRITDDLKKNHRHNIDYQINELAECAVSVAGRLTISDTAVRQPYFSGLIIKDGEMAAVTLGRGCCYLYRDDALYPLTHDDYRLEAVDNFGRPVSNMNDFSAGVAGTIRYSNIAQLKPDDCVILCNYEVMEAIGQKRLLRILDEAEDQQEAAGMVLDEAAVEQPNASLQFMIGFVEDLLTIDRLGRTTMARGLTGRGTGRVGLPKTDRSTQSKLFSQFGDASTAFAPESNPDDKRQAYGRQEPAADRSTGPVQQKYDAPFDDSSAAASSAQPTPYTDPEVNRYKPVDAVTPGADAYNSTYTPANSSSNDTSAQIPPAGAADSAAGTAAQAAEGQTGADYDLDAIWNATKREPEPYNQNAAATQNSYPDQGGYDDNQPYGGPGKPNEEQVKKIAAIALGAVALILLIFIIVSLVRGSSKSSNQPSFNTSTSLTSQVSSTTAATESSNNAGITTASGSSSLTLPTTSESTSTETTTTEATTTTEVTTTTTETTTTEATEAPTSGAKSYTIQAGDSFWAIAKSQYNLSDGDDVSKYMQAIIDANGLSGPDALLTPGESLIIPEVN
ncbi:LysM peptidoglycan-binding domain-containing protein [Oscillospiraceae bacterium HV4-5-C5C]|nr:LysM peptidoglycan-binding domain-containing protein [Oscillospiraceae bacterium HV4-5-C5C]